MNVFIIESMNPVNSIHKRDTVSVHKWLGPYCIVSFVEGKFIFEFPSGE